MKRCPECGREYDNTMMFCLDDGAELLYGPASMDEPATAILHSTDAPGEAPTRAQINTTDQTAILCAGAEAKPQGKLEDSTEKRSFSANRAAKPLVASVIVLLILVGGFFGYRYFKPRDTGQINSIAVLPFANSSGDKETDFLADGIAETLINNFTKIPDLKVTARSTAFRFRGREGEPQAVGRELGVGSMLTGKLLQRGDSLSIQVDLVNTTDGAQIWGNRYEGKATDIVTIQQKIATDVSSHLKLKLTGAQAQQIAKTYTQNPEAYQHYLRGRFHWNKRTADDLKKALQEFQAAADNDPGYALAYVGLADTYVILEEYAGISAAETLPKGRAFAEKALQIDDSLGEAHATLGLISDNSWQWAEAERHFQRSIELSPNYPTVHHWYAIYLRERGQTERGYAEIKRAVELDPLSRIIAVNVGVLEMIRNDSNAAVSQFTRTIELDPNWWAGHYWLGIVHLKFGRPREAIAEFEKSVELNRSPATLAYLGHAYAATGRESDARRILGELEQLYAKGQATEWSMAILNSGLGNNDKTFEWLEKAFKVKSGELARVRWFPAFASIRSDLRTMDLLKRMGLPE